MPKDTVKQAGAAIHVRYLGPTDHRGSRLVATADMAVPETGKDARVVMSYNAAAIESGADGGVRVAFVAARRLALQVGWGMVELIGGHLPDGSYVFLRRWN